MIAKVYQVDPLLCARCGQRMSIVGFVTDSVAIGRILDYLGALRQLGLQGEVRRGDAVGERWPQAGGGILAAFTVNELSEPARERLRTRLLEAARARSTVLVVEPIARAVSPWWPDWAAAFRAAGAREDEWRFRVPLPPSLALLAKAAGLDARALLGRSLALRGA